MKRNGFTLVEMLVALGIFALLAAAGVGVLRSSVDVQATVDTRLSEMSGIARLNALLSNDLAQAVVRPSRSPSGQRPAFAGDSSGMAFVSGGRTNVDGAPRSELQRIEWRSSNGALRRKGLASVDGSEEGVASALARDVRSASFRYRLPNGSWAPFFISSERQPLPAAVELTMEQSAKAPIVMVFALPSGAISPSTEGALTGGQGA